MTDTLISIHRISGYVVLAVVVVAAVYGRSQGRAARPFTATPFAVTVGLVDLQVVLGLIVYGLAEVWQSDDALIAYVHPALALVAVVVAHVAVRRARGHQMVTDAYRVAGSGMWATAFFLAAAAGVAAST